MTRGNEKRRFCLIGPTYPYRGGISHYNTCLIRELSAAGDVCAINFTRLYPGFLFPGTTQLDESERPLDGRIDAPHRFDQSLHMDQGGRARGALQARSRSRAVVASVLRPRDVHDMLRAEAHAPREGRVHLPQRAPAREVARRPFPRGARLLRRRRLPRPVAGGPGQAAPHPPKTPPSSRIRIRYTISSARAA